MPYIGKSPSQAVRNRYYFTVASGATSVSGSDDNSNTLIFADGTYVDVYLNGVLLVADTDYNTTTANTIAGLSAMSANDVVEVIVYDVFSVFSGNVNSDFSVGGDATVAGTTSLTGKVGIGIATASEMLEVFNAASPAIQLNDGGDYQAQFVLAGNDLEIRGSSGQLELYNGTADGASSTKHFVMAANGEVTFSAEDPANAAFNSFNSSALTVNKYGGTTNGSAFTASSSNATAAIAAENAKGQIGTVTNHPLEIRTNNTVAINIDTTGAVTMPLTPAFSAFPAGVQSNFAINTAVTVAFGTELFDQNADYNDQDTFTAPVTGKYQLTAYVDFQTLDTAATFYQLSIATSNKSQSLTLDPNFSSDMNQYPMLMTILADMDASDTAQVFVFQSGGTAQTDISIASYFTGFLAC